MLRSIPFALIAVLLAASVASAQPKFRPQSSPEDRACRGDAHRFCRDLFPDQFRVLGCLQSHRAKLSRACRGVLESHGR
jgi:hypothetical protein